MTLVVAKGNNNHDMHTDKYSSKLLCMKNIPNPKTPCSDHLLTH